jgi:benzoyl-CoA reductase/2-hydroxyglutaryl-CoA dehydratase subunit BcrC/BadD/HgdB
VNITSEIRQRVERRPDELAKLREQGKKVVGWSGYGVPEEILYALGIIPIRVALGGDEKLVEVGARYVSSRNCVYIRELLGFIAENKHPLIRQIDSYAFDATCLHTFRAAEITEFYFDKRVFVLAVPRNFHWDEAREYFVKESEAFAAELEEYAGEKLTREKIEAAIALFDKIRSFLVRLYDLQIETTLSWNEVYEIIQAGYTLDKKEYAALLEKAVAEAENYPETRDDGGGARVFISGTLLPAGDTKLINLITELGGEIVGDDLWSGIIPYLDLNISEPTVSGVALGYLDRTPHGALPYFDLKTDRRLAKLRGLIRKTRADGVVFHTLRYCDPYSFKALETKNVLAEHGVPLMEIHTEYAGNDVEAIRTRIEAFLEMLANK